MPFNTALSGLRAANSDLRITGNNVANASTTGFKSSRAEFGDVYASTVLGGGGNSIGSGVKLQNVAQQFSQGTTSFTQNELDMSIGGSGFFIVEDGGDQLYTRSGAFSLDGDGFVVTNQGARLQGFTADDDGNINGILGDIQINAGSIEPRQTTAVTSSVNVDATEPVLQRDGLVFSTTGASIAVPQIGLQNELTTQLHGDSAAYAGIALGPASTIDFTVTLSGAAENNGAVPIVLAEADHAVLFGGTGNFSQLSLLVGDINDQILTASPPIDILATAVDEGGGNFHIEFEALTGGEPSTIDISAGSNHGVIGLADGDISTNPLPAGQAKDARRPSALIPRR